MDRSIRNEQKENSNGISSTNGNSISSNDSSNQNGTSNLTPEERERHDLFLSTFEKPTQIYRFLRTRHFFSPVFLHRTLSYMKHRMSRDHSKRNNFSVDSLLDSCLKEKKSNETKSSKFGNLIIEFLGIQNRTFDTKTTVNVIVSLLKMSTKSSNSLLASNNEIVIGECKLNPNDLSNKLTIQKENFISNLKNVLLFKVIIKSNHSSSLTNGDSFNHDNCREDAQPIKRRKTSSEISMYKAELNMNDVNQECLLKDGEYQLALSESAVTVNGTNGEAKAAIQDRFNNFIWRSASQLDSTSVKDLNQEPCLIFALNWSSSDHHDSTLKSPIKPYSIKNNQTQPLKQIDPPNTEINNKSFSKNSNKKFANSVHLNGTMTNGLLTNGFISSNSNDQVFSTQLQPDQGQRKGTSSKVIYRFSFNNQLLQQTKPQSDFKCPWCGLDCSQIYSLKHHLQNVHDRFNFTIIVENKGYKVDVTINDAYDGSYDGNPQQDMSKFSWREKHGPTRRTPATLFQVNLRGKARKILSDKLDNVTIDVDFIKPQVHGHNRLYYHSGTCQPIKPHELDQDSEDEIDPEWMRIKTQLMIDEFTDVNEGEKEVMKLWNLHMMKYNFVGGVHVPLACEMFVKENWREIVNRNIYMNFVLHLNNLFDFGLLTSSALRNTVKLFQEIKHENFIEN